jgi:hypothetical protein
MKTTTLENLITARILLGEAERHCAQGDRYSATAGLIVLQDAVELVLMSVLTEKGLDEQQPIEKFSFDDSIAAVKKLGISIPKSAKLKAMNKLRVTAKHYGEIMEPSAVQSHLDAAKISIDSILVEAIGRPLSEIYLTELVSGSRVRWHLDKAVAALAEGKYLDAMIAARKAFYLEFEAAYSVYHYRSSAIYSASSFHWEGYKAKVECRDPEWIKLHVTDPIEFIQIEPDRWRIDSLEWGISTQLLNNIRTLTPSVILLDNRDDDQGGRWAVKHHASYNLVGPTKETAVLCVDLIIEAIHRKQLHLKEAKGLYLDKPCSIPKEYVGQVVYAKASDDSDEKHRLGAGDETSVSRILDGFNEEEKYYFIVCIPDGGGIFTGYVKSIPGVRLDQLEKADYRSNFLKTFTF